MTQHILVVDDDKEVREIVLFVLSHHGFSVATANNGQHMREALAQRLPDVLILDVMMPGEDGYSLCSSLRSDLRTRHIPIIMMTAHDEDIYERISRDLGVSEHLTKPFHPLELVEHVQAILQATSQN